MTVDNTHYYVPPTDRYIRYQVQEKGIELSLEEKITNLFSKLANFFQGIFSYIKDAILNSKCSR